MYITFILQSNVDGSILPEVQDVSSISVYLSKNFNSYNKATNSPVWIGNGEYKLELTSEETVFDELHYQVVYSGAITNTYAVDAQSGGSGASAQQVWNYNFGTEEEPKLAKDVLNNIASKVWDELLNNHTIDGSAGKKLYDMKTWDTSWGRPTITGISRREFTVDVIRSAIESKYIGTCNIYGYTTSTDSDGLSTTSETTLYTNQACRVSFTISPELDQTFTLAETTQRIRLFISEKLTIPAGSKITVTQNGSTNSYKHSGTVAMYKTHQEIDLIPWEDYA